MGARLSASCAGPWDTMGDVVSAGVGIGRVEDCGGGL